MSIKDKAYIVGIYEHPTRLATDKTVMQLHAERRRELRNRSGEDHRAPRSVLFENFEALRLRERAHLGEIRRIRAVLAVLGDGPEPPGELAGRLELRGAGVMQAAAFRHRQPKIRRP